MDEDFYLGSAAWRVYFDVSTAEGEAVLSVNHVPTRMRLSLPVHPSDATPGALPYLEPAFAHYVSQWQRIMPPDLQEKDALGFYLEASELPERIADPANAAELSNIATAYSTDATRRFFKGMVPFQALVWGQDWWPGNEPDFCRPAAEYGIDSYQG